MDYSNKDFKNFYLSDNQEIDHTDDEEGTLGYKIRQAITKRPKNSIDCFFENPKKRKIVKKQSSSVGQSSSDGIAYITSNVDDGKYATHMIKIQVYELNKIKEIAPTEHWKHAEVTVKYYAECESDKHLQSVRDVIYDITSTLVSQKDSTKYFIENNKKTSKYSPSV